MTLPIAVLDFETDPFKYGRTVRPFACGFYNGSIYKDFWGDDVVEQVLRFLLELGLEEPHLIYAHNGGKFDFLFLLHEFSGALRVVNGRVLQGELFGNEMRDSYGILPIPLGAYKKDDIDYEWFERDVRDKHRKAILEYQKSDCIYLYELVSGFHREFGDKLTIGGTALGILQEMHPFEKVTKVFDKTFRDYYFGGRVQCFESGVVHGDFKVYDVNSEYPSVMRNFKHPISLFHRVDNRIGPDTAFILCEGWNKGAFCMRMEDGSIDFTVEYGKFYTTIHEYKAALELGLFKTKKILATHDFDKFTTFKDFVDTYYAKRVKAGEDGDEMRKLFYKLILNSAYGKFAQNPEDFVDYSIYEDGYMPGDPWKLYEQLNGYNIWWKESSSRYGYYNIATAASITGAARSILMRGIAGATRPVYCDTDSIICEALDAEIDPKKLGAWKFEGKGDRMAIAGKKMYALFSNGECIKQASKGARIKPSEIVQVAQGGEILYKQDAPSMKVDGRQVSMQRRIRSTIKSQK